MKLFMFYVGGDCGGSNIELHDIRFSVGETFEDCYPDLRKQWWGDPGSLHLDCWGQVEQVEGYDVELTLDVIDVDQPKLFFLNMGGYDTSKFEELHHNVLVVVPDERAARLEGLARVRHWTQPHKDNVFEVEKAVDVSAAMQAYGYALRLTKATAPKDFVFGCGFVRLGMEEPKGHDPVFSSIAGAREGRSILPQLRFCVLGGTGRLGPGR